MYKRIINLDQALARKSVFLFGPRQTGKSTFLRAGYPEALYINLLSKRVFDDYSLRSGALESDLELHFRKNSSPIIVIDEIQKIPSLLDEVHNQIEQNKKLRFILTGSSARKLRRSSANLLGGRATWRTMFPLTYPEMSDQLQTLKDLERRLLVGGLPSMVDSSHPFEDFDDYLQLYLNEEIRAEGLVRNYEAFQRFLITSALVNAKQLNFTAVGSDSQVPPRTVHEYFQILEDTLIGTLLLPFTKTPSRKAVASAKFFLFDTGLVNALLRRSVLNAGTPEFGDLFEQFVVSEVRAFLSYNNKRTELFYWRSTSKMEVDLILKNDDKLWAIEIKAKNNITSRDYRGMEAFCEDFPKTKKIVVFLEGRHHLNEDKIEFIPVIKFLKMLWADEFMF